MAADNAKIPTPSQQAPIEPPSQRGLTYEQERELEAARLERIKAETELARITAESRKQTALNAELKQKSGLRSAFREAGVKFHNESDALTLLGEIEYDENGVPSIDGKLLSESLQDLALRHENLVDGRTLRGLKERRAKDQPQAKSDFKTVEEKTAFIEKHGMAAYEKLPRVSPLNLGGKLPQTWDQYKALSLGERSKIAGEQGAAFIARLHATRARA